MPAPQHTIDRDLALDAAYAARSRAKHRAAEALMRAELIADANYSIAYNAAWRAWQIAEGLIPRPLGGQP